MSFFGFYDIKLYKLYISAYTCSDCKTIAIISYVILQAVHCDFVERMAFGMTL